MKKESEKKPLKLEKSKGQEPSLHDLYFTDDIDLEEELRLVAADPTLKDVTADPDALDKIKEAWALRKSTDTEMSEELGDIRGVVSKEELSHLSPEARELIELGMKAKEESEADEDQPKVRHIRKRNKRILFAVAAIVTLSLAGSTTGVTSMFKYLQVKDVGEEVEYRMVESEEDAVLPDVALSEKEAYEHVNKFFGLEVVEIHGYQADLEFSNLVLYEEDMSADIIYYWGDKSIFYSIQSNYNQLSQMTGVDEDAIVQSELIKDGIKINSVKHSEGIDSQYYHYVTFEYNGLYYKIVSCNVDDDVINNIIKFLFF